jgi:hypothetical protein
MGIVRRPGPEWSDRAVVGVAGALALCVFTLLVAAPWGATSPPRPLAPAQATATDTEEPTEVPPTPVPVTETPPVPERCVRGLPSPRFEWTLYVTPFSGGLGMWVPRGENAGPYLKAYVKAKYGEVWYGATLLPDGRMVPDHSPPWPRPDLIQSAANGLQTARSGNATCGRQPQQSVPPCFVEVVYPLVFLDRLAEQGPFLTRTYFWVPSSQLVKENDRPAQVVGAPFSETLCDARKIWPRLGASLPAYGVFNGCGSASTRIDTCYAVGCGVYAGEACP